MTRLRYNSKGEGSKASGIIPVFVWLKHHPANKKKKLQRARMGLVVKSNFNHSNLEVFENISGKNT